MRKSLTHIALATAAVAVTPAAYAQNYDEQLAKLSERFEKADANGDGKLTKEEAESGGMSRVAKFFGRLDSDDDGFITFDQIKARLDARSKKAS